MSVVEIHACQNSRAYEDAGAFDLWEQLGAEEISKERVFYDRKIDPEEGHTYEVSLSFKDRLRVLFGKTPAIVDRWTGVVVSDLSDLEQLSEDERRLARSWVLGGNAPGIKSPTPSEQGEQALRLVREFPREFSPEMVAAINALPKADELVIKLPRELKAGEKSALRRKINAIVAGKPVSMRVKL
jgi:hypothetical protein